MRAVSLFICVVVFLMLVLMERICIVERSVSLDWPVVVAELMRYVSMLCMILGEGDADSVDRLVYFMAADAAKPKEVHTRECVCILSLLHLLSFFLSFRH